MHVQIGIKKFNIHENSYMLWHQRLGHVFIDIFKRLVKGGVLNTLEFVEFEMCVDYLKG